MTGPSAAPTAFVLAGGGSLGAIEVGMLEALVEYGVSPDFLVGTSAGAINAAYFAGRPDLIGVRALGKIWRGLRRRDVFSVDLFGSLLSLLGRRNHLVDPRPLRRLLTRFLPFRDLEDTAVPIQVVATDILTGQEVVLSSGPAVDALLASAAIPAVFPPIPFEGRYLVDGGVANNTPISVAVERGANCIIVLPTGFACELAEPPKSSIGMALQALNLLIARRTVLDIERYIGVVDLRIVPPLCPIEKGAHDFSDLGELIDRALLSTTRWIEDGGLESVAIPPQLLPHPHARSL
jgi:NTE family protein